MRRRRKEPDTRPSWRDPAMPVLRPVEEFGRVTMEEFTPQDEQQRARMMLEIQMDNPKCPRWIDDATYHPARRGRRRRL